MSMMNHTNGASEDAPFLGHPACYYIGVMNMKYRRIKKYAIHILSVSALNHSVVDVSDEEGAFIILTKVTNSRSFHMAQKKRSTGKYERWQILW